MDDGCYWVDDGTGRIAVLPEKKRLMRHYAKGIAARLDQVTGSYLRGKIKIPAGAVCINVGANVGEVSLRLAMMGAGQVIAIEPDPQTFRILRANVGDNPIIPLNAAAWRSDEEVKIFLLPEKADTSIFNESDRSTMASGRRLDSIAADYGLDRIHLILGDAEGAEPEVLEGASGILNKTNYVSLRCSAERNGETTLDRCESILRDFDFDIIHRDASGFCTLIGKGPA